jgi:hypothetical protein
MNRLNLLLTVAFLALPAGGAFAQTAQVTAMGQSHAAVRAYWTPARLAAAKPMELTASGAIGQATTNAAATGPKVAGDGAPPTSDIAPVNEFLYKVPPASPADNAVTPMASSSFGAVFTTSRVFPDAATLTWPFRTAGKLYFHDPVAGGNFICSASTLRSRIIVTAGHCVWHASATAASRYVYDQFLFVPALRQIPPASAVAPLCSWTVSAFAVAPEWRNGTGQVPNAQDVALLEARDQACPSGGAVKKLGNITGILGYSTNDLIPQSITQIGYPKGLDGGLRMEVTWAESFNTRSPNTVTIGSAMRAGASGGPWIKNFGVNPDDADHPLPSRNLLVSVSSYGPNTTEPQYLGGSILNNSFVTILNTICAHKSGNCP